MNHQLPFLYNNPYIQDLELQSQLQNLHLPQPMDEQVLL